MYILLLLIILVLYTIFVFLIILIIVVELNYFKLFLLNIIYEIIAPLKY